MDRDITELIERLLDIQSGGRQRKSLAQSAENSRSMEYLEKPQEEACRITAH